ncbi:hypothetical protein [Peptostreptococcus equinus]|uniref:DUF5050 domain-containing protein n=1 Tax=Peptostreptococcus equinus TaxID=3003601 RepID=A0ABY7JTJ6_9FIRM|nr:hypothetical protein [Peptostreptococcus sp. CBA3647]WAW14609.1 hypothetical protein O0R46_08400 [Peptostreptococcus sp. CBA3647]WAW15300.1 hypothetical protein O0R46_02275 [Peptostreptococcus sp. CBA3647]
MAIRFNRKVYDKILAEFEPISKSLISNLQSVVSPTSAITNLKTLADRVALAEHLDMVKADTYKPLFPINGITENMFIVSACRGKVYIFYNPTSTSDNVTEVFIYDPFTNTVGGLKNKNISPPYSRLPTMGAIDDFVFTYEENIYYKGADSTTGNTVIYKFDTGYETSEVFTTLNVSIKNTRVFNNGSDAYICYTPGPGIRRMYKLNMVTKTLTLIKDFGFTNTSNVTIGHFYNGNIYLLESSVDQSNYVLYKYNPVTGTSTNAKTIPKATSSSTMEGIGVGKYIYIFSHIMGTMTILNLDTYTIEEQGIDYNLGGGLTPKVCMNRNRIYVYDNPWLGIVYPRLK